MKQLVILPLEPIDTRYTGQWYWHLPKLMSDFIINNEIVDTEVVVVGGESIPNQTTDGAFLDFKNTNIYKNTQINKLIEMVSDETILPGATLIFPDAWHPGIIQCKYISDLLFLDFKIHAIWHAGSYDENDFLGRRIKNKTWSYNFERSIFYACDKNYFASEYHIDIFKNVILKNDDAKEYYDKIVRTGLPFEYLPSLLSPYKEAKKRDLILFPHRVAPEKQIEIFKDLALSLPEYEWVVCQERRLTKDQYHELLGEAKIVFSANLQETLGISMMEGLLAGAIPMVPDRLSYHEMFSGMCYNSDWTINYQKYLENKEEIIKLIQSYINNYDHIINSIEWKDTEKFLEKNYFSANKFLENIFELKHEYDKHSN
jgi:hypothetical protein